MVPKSRRKPPDETGKIRPQHAWRQGRKRMSTKGNPPRPDEEIAKTQKMSPGENLAGPAGADKTTREAADSSKTLIDGRAAIGSGTGGGFAAEWGGNLKGWEITRRFPAQGGEADVYLVRKGAAEQILKLYRWGIQPKIEVLDRIIKLYGSNKDCFVQVTERGYEPESKRFFELEEFFPLGSLRDYMNEVSLSEVQIGAFCERLAKALIALHENGILHLDLKPDNVLVRTKDPLDVVLTDFGIASILDEEFSKKMTDIKGTSLYQSPESLSGVVGPKSDYWSLGIILLEMLQHKHPFEGLQRQVIYYRLTTAGIPIPGHLPPRWINLLKGLLTRNPEIRWGTREVAEWLKGSEVQTFFDAENAQAMLQGIVDSGDSSFRRFELPFSFAGKSFFALEDLLRVFASSPEFWSQGKVVIGRGQVSRWLEDNNDAERSGKLADIMDAETDPDRMIFKVLYTFFPDLPPVWSGKILNRPTLMELMARACDAGVAGEEEKLLEGLFTGEFFQDYLTLTGKHLDDLADVLKLAKCLIISELRGLPLTERTRIILFVLQKSYEPDKALDSLQMAMTSDREFQLILQSAGNRGFPDFARRAGFWKKDEDAAWRMASELYARSSQIVIESLDILVRMSTVIAASIGKDHSLRDLLFALTLRNLMDPDMFERWNNLREKHLWLNDVARISYAIPRDIETALYIENRIQSKLLIERWPRLAEFILPPFFEKARRGEIIPAGQLQVIREVLPHPRVLIPREGSLTAWGSLSDWLEDLPENGTRVDSYADLLEVKKAYARTIGLRHQVKIGLAGAFMTGVLLWHYAGIDVLVLTALACFLVSVFWPVCRKSEIGRSWCGKPPFESVFSDPVLVRQKAPKPFNYFNRAGFVFLILRLSVFHPDFVNFLYTLAYLIWGRPNP
jgi:serine/threonine protein kinase